MKVLFVMRHEGFVRNFESTLSLLAERGHEVHVAFDGPFAHARVDGRPGIVERLAAERPTSITFGPAPRRVREPWPGLGVRLRLAADYLRYLSPRYAEATKLRARAAEHVGPLARGMGRLADRWAGGPAALVRLLRHLDACLPVSRSASAFVRERRPDVLLVTPLVELGEPQTDFLRAAKGLGVPTALCVASWDNLTNKGSVPEAPELVTVWNEAQRREAVELHGVPPERLVATGAQAYDHWFDWAPCSERAGFAARAGLPDGRPFVLYLCSSRFIAPDEADFVRGWLAALRARPEPALREAAVLVRPHPQHAGQWRAADLSGLGPVSVWPPGGADPTDAGSRCDYFDSIHHCAAVVGVNTSALIESAIVGRPVFTYLAPEFCETQRGTLHFAHLADDGPLRVAESFEEHAAQLALVLAEPARAHPSAEAFLRSFVRPHGLDSAATPRLVAALEGLATTSPEPRRPPAASRQVKVALAPLAGLAWVDSAARRLARRVLALPALRGPMRRLGVECAE